MNKGFEKHFEAVSWLKYRGFSGYKNNYYLPDFGYADDPLDVTSEGEQLQVGRVMRNAVIEKRDDERYYINIFDPDNNVQQEMRWK